MTDTIIVLQNEREEQVRVLKEKERTTIEDLQTQEKSCIEKYGRYAQQAKDPELKNLFQTLQQKEREHYDSLDCVLRGEVPQCNCNDSDGRDYQPKATYTAMSSPEVNSRIHFLQQIVLRRKSWCQENITQKYLLLATAVCASCLQIFR